MCSKYAYEVNATNWAFRIILQQIFQFCLSIFMWLPLSNSQQKMHRDANISTVEEKITNEKIKRKRGRKENQFNLLEAQNAVIVYCFSSSAAAPFAIVIIVIAAKLSLSWSVYFKSNADSLLQKREIIWNESLVWYGIQLAIQV